MNAPLPPGAVVDLDEDEALIDADGASIEPTADGGMVVDFEPREQPQPQQKPGTGNIAVSLPDAELVRMGEKIVEYVQADRKSRQPWFDHFRKGLEKAGALPVDVTPSFAGQSTAVHPLIMEAATQFQARAIAEIFPPTGPVKGKVLGESNAALEQQADRVAKFLNWQLQWEDEEYFADVDQMLFVLPFAGSCFKKSYIDPETEVVTSRYVQAEDVLLPYTFRGHIKRAPRITHVFQLSHQDFQDRQARGYYLPMTRLKLQVPSGPTLTDQQDRTDTRADGVTPSDVDEDREHTILECHTRWVLGGESAAADVRMGNYGTVVPVVITVEEETHKVCSVRLNVRPGRNGRPTARCWWTHYKYLPGFGAYGYGLIHAIGGLQQAGSEVLQELLHSARFAARQGGFTTKEARLPKKVMHLEPGVYQQTDMTAEEISKAFYTPPFKEPATALFNVLGLITEFGQRFASTADAMVGGGSENTPVGTTIARIEQGSKVYSAIHMRTHRTAAEEFRLRAELLYEQLMTSGPRQGLIEGATLQITPEDLDPRIDIEPVSDPNIVSTPQRIAMAEAVAARAAVAPGLYDKIEVERLYLQSMKVPDFERLLMQPGEVKPLDPVSEGQVAMTGGAIRAFVEQDHAAHLAVHQGQVMMVQGTPIAEMVLPALQAHVAEHIALQYRLTMMQQMGVELPPLEQLQGEDSQGIAPEVDAQISQRAAMVVQQQAAEAQAAAVAEQAGMPNADFAMQAAQHDVEAKGLANRKAEREIEMMDRDTAGEMQAVVQEAIAPLQEQLMGLTAERDKAQAALEKASEEFGRQLADMEARRLADEERREREEESREEEDEREREAEESARAIKAAEEKVKAAEAKAKESDGAVEKLAKQIADIAKAVDALAKQERTEKPEPAPIVMPIIMPGAPAEAGEQSIEIMKQGDKWVATKSTRPKKK